MSKRTSSSTSGVPACRRLASLQHVVTNGRACGGGARVVVARGHGSETRGSCESPARRVPLRPGRGLGDADGARQRVRVRCPPPAFRSGLGRRASRAGPPSPHRYTRLLVLRSQGPACAPGVVIPAPRLPHTALYATRGATVGVDVHIFICVTPCGSRAARGRPVGGTAPLGVSCGRARFRDGCGSAFRSTSRSQ